MAPKKQASQEKESNKQSTLGIKIGIAVVLISIVLMFSACTVVFMQLSSFESSSSRTSGSVAIVPVQGTILTTGSSTRATITADDMTRILYDLKDNNRVKAVILDINSGGGSPVGSDEIGQALQALRAEKPVVSVIREVGASGAYWVATNTDYIIANPMSITGSIGVTASSFGIDELLDEFNVTYRRLVTGERKDLGSPFREMTQEELLFLQDKIDSIHDFFVQEVATNRNMSFEEVQELATGEFFLGFEAQNKGLVDSLGGMREAENYLRELGIEPETYRVRIRTSLFDDLFSINLQLDPQIQQQLLVQR